MSIIDELLKDIPLPRMVKVKQRFHAPELEDTAEAVKKTLHETNVLQKVSPGDSVAIAVGSRGVADLPILVRETVRGIKGVGGHPFIVPAMGSHGGATAEGQADVLKHMGVTEESCGAPIRSTMEVVKIGELPNGLPVFIDKNAYEADKIVVINRIKAHTAFRGPIESGLMKMITIGLGKQKGAEAAHSFSFKYMAEHVPEMAKISLSQTPIIFGLASLENAYERPAKVIAVAAEDLEEMEPVLLKEAKSLMARIYFDKFDVLIVDELGKDISGDGMDPNITGKFPTPYANGGPDVTRIAVLGLTKISNGNANGIGLADLTTRAVADEIVSEKGYANALTSTVVEVVKLPMVLETKELAVKAAIKTCGAFDLKQVRVVRIKNTLDIGEIWISESMVSEAEGNPNLEISSKPEIMTFN